MKLQIKRSAIITMVFIALLCTAPTKGLWAAAGPQVHVNINIGAPPPVVVYSPPTMVYLAEPAAYVAVGIPYDIFFVSGRYYYRHNNDWFWAQAYNGPWSYVSYRALPTGLRTYNVTRLHQFRDREYRVYRTQGPAFKGRHFEAAEYRNSSKPGRGNGNGNGNGRRGR